MFGHSHSRRQYTQNRNRFVYLPFDKNYYFNFFTGKTFKSGTVVTITNLPINEMALFIRAGTILPLGPDLQFVTERTRST